MSIDLDRALAPWPTVGDQVASLTTILRRGTLHDSRTLTGLTAGLLKCLVSSPESSLLSLEVVLTAVLALAVHFSTAAPTQFAVGSVARRVAAIIDEEVAKLNPSLEDEALGVSIAAVRERAIRAVATDQHQQLHQRNTLPAPFRLFSDVQEGVVDGVAELQDEIDALGSSFESQALDLCCPGDTLLTHGHSRTALGLLAHAAKKAKVGLLVTEGGVSMLGHAAVASLAPSAASTRTVSRALIPDAAVFAVMPRVTKVILGARAVTSDGGAVADAGALAVAQAAAAHGVPVLIVCSVMKLVPQTSLGLALGTRTLALGAPTDALPQLLADQAGGAEAISPILDFIPAALISLIVTNAQAVAPPQVARLCAETYGARAMGLSGTG